MTEHEIFTAAIKLTGDRAWFNKATRWMESEGANDEQLTRFHAEAESLFGLQATEPSLGPG